ncbi:tRNA (guanine(46)-N(7))-methyltransferase TrmB [Vineibacter terrae]|uniref:tRNA (guanine(46)-N(7))-methyltransferase TrmB n=1 Tax=Vineibacter terrae TaxID=2586908 RepID=UPI002E3256BE|nr:tRNA (guanine(46)-N(7))-methyltransferase TrmB [Vineibacter terrae]HEX2890315.1 tRNA (guanine(46)-N(7))-methyltransferase TrmB [Vineibacter terrae]
MTGSLPQPDEAERRRTLYGRRRGKKLRSGQQGLLESLLPRLRVPARHSLEPADHAPLDLPGLFGRAMPGGYWLEVGFGSGEHLVWQAEHHPDVGLIGCEPYVNGIAKCLAHVERTGVGNVRVFDDDARFVMAALPPGSLGRAFVLFPDPWPKARHQKRRFVCRETLDRLAELMVPDGELRLATDDPVHLPWMLEQACLHPAFTWLAERPADWRQRSADWPPTRYEQKMLAGRRPVFLRFRRT